MLSELQLRGFINIPYQASLGDDVRRGNIVINAPTAWGDLAWRCEFEITGMHSAWHAAGMSPLGAIFSAMRMLNVIISIRYRDWAFQDENGGALLLDNEARI
ncbi:hypothetical protein [Brevundimonas sp.]|jgi:hypothetical protein|uniref:hypothetical protein n=1 Tax=Brevundimonas sp. TaxID=1871086 RepID=UPI0037C12CE5